MEITKMTHNDGLLTATASFLALVLSQISTLLTDENFLKYVTALSSVVLCITAVVKFIDLMAKKIPQFIAFIKRQFKKPSKP